MRIRPIGTTARLVTMASLLTALSAAQVEAQAQPHAPSHAPAQPPTQAAAPMPAADTTAGPKVGETAPEFTAPGARISGVLATPVRLGDFRGKTVVLAFFPKARTKGCTVQMETYRDRYAQLFHGGENTVLIAISADADTTLAAWAREKQFPQLFVSDADGAIGRAYGAWNAARGIDSRFVYVIDPSGKVSYRATPFREMTEQAYVDLGAAIGRVTSGS